MGGWGGGKLLRPCGIPTIEWISFNQVNGPKITPMFSERLFMVVDLRNYLCACNGFRKLIGRERCPDT